jgi:hypothetical protein
MSQFLDNLSRGLICIDNSSFQNLDCPRKFSIAVIHKYKPIGDRSPLVYGQAVHKILETYYLEIWKGKKTQEIDTTGIIQSVVAEFQQKLDILCDPKRNTTSLIEFMHSYFNNARVFGENLMPLTLPDGKPAIEVSFSLPICQVTYKGNPITVMWEGRLDLIAKDSNGNPGIWDHKTTSMLGDSFLDQFLRCNQFEGYLYAANILTGAASLDPITRVGINALANKKVSEFKQYFFHRPNWSTHDFIDDVKTRIQGFLNYYAENEDIAPTLLSGCRSACSGKYGKCTFFDLCEVPPHLRQVALTKSGSYELNPWSPLAND